MDDPRTLSNRRDAPRYASEVMNRPWLGWLLLGVSVGFVAIAFAEWEDDRGEAITWGPPECRGRCPRDLHPSVLEQDPTT
jgi:hypothetical protein